MSKWIAVQVSAGLFPTERTVQFETVEGPVSLFVQSGQLDEQAKRLKVMILDQDDKYALVQVPSPSGTAVAKVLRTNLY
jgi:hypothetical protein